MAPQFLLLQAQNAYETFMKDSNLSIKRNTRAIVTMSEAKAKREQELTSSKQDVAATLKVLENLHNMAGELNDRCSWLLKNFDKRQEARAAEVDALKEAGGPRGDPASAHRRGLQLRRWPLTFETPQRGVRGRARRCRLQGLDPLACFLLSPTPWSTADAKARRASRGAPATANAVAAPSRARPFARLLQSTMPPNGGRLGFFLLCLREGPAATVSLEASRHRNRQGRARALHPDKQPPGATDAQRSRAKRAFQPPGHEPSGAVVSTVAREVHDGLRGARAAAPDSGCPEGAAAAGAAPRAARAARREADAPADRARAQARAEEDARRRLEHEERDRREQAEERERRRLQARLQERADGLGATWVLPPRARGRPRTEWRGWDPDGEADDGSDTSSTLSFDIHIDLQGLDLDNLELIEDETTEAQLMGLGGGERWTINVAPPPPQASQGSSILLVPWILEGRAAAVPPGAGPFGRPAMAAAAPKAGDSVEVVGLATPAGRALNGQKGVVVQFHEAKGSFEVQLGRSDRRVSLKLENLLVDQPRRTDEEKAAATRIQSVHRGKQAGSLGYSHKVTAAAGPARDDPPSLRPAAASAALPELPDAASEEDPAVPEASEAASEEWCLSARWSAEGDAEKTAQGSEEENAAAAKIQAVHRGNQARGLVQDQRTAAAFLAREDPPQGTDEENVAAAKLQAAFLARGDPPRGTDEEYAAAAKIQAVHRGIQARSSIERKRTAALSLVREEPTHGTDEESPAADGIQATRCGRQARSSGASGAASSAREDLPVGNDEEHAAAVRIQAVHRGKRARSSAASKRKAGTDEEHAAAARIQAAHRGKQARRPHAAAAGPARGEE
ncbi:unnamed protein product, partial [Prorocentrum cordatum]